MPRRRLRLPLWSAAILSILVFGNAGAAVAQDEEQNAGELILGARLFKEIRLTNPGGNLAASCASCHKIGENVEGKGKRTYADFIAKSLLPTNRTDQRTTLRNTPTLLDVGEMPRLYLDGRFTSLEELIKAKLASPHLGWLPSEKERVTGEIETLIKYDEGEGTAATAPYPEQFKKAYDVDVTALSGEAVMDRVAQALSAHLRTLNSTETSRWDAFRGMNRIQVGPKEGQEIIVFSGRLFGHLANQEGRQSMKRPEGFSPEAYQGFKTFFRIEDEFGEGKLPIGNCISCHVPPSFTDNKFHNTGIAQLEYDEIHGDGAFGELEIPKAEEAERPSAKFLSAPTADDPGAADLGHWNYVDLEDSPQREGDESDEEFLARMVGAFKTPTLRNLASTKPFTHTGQYQTLQQMVTEIVRVTRLAQEGKLRGVDEEYLKMKLSEDDIKPLAAFLEMLEEVGRDGFRYYLFNLEND